MAGCTSSTSSVASSAATGSSAGTCRLPADSRSPPTTRGPRIALLYLFGDGASNEGKFREALNLAALWKLPVLFLVENNLFGMGTELQRLSAVHRPLSPRDGFGVPGPELRRHGRARGVHADVRGDRRAREAASRCSWRPSPTASAATRWRTRSSIARKRKSKSGASAIRSSLPQAAAARGRDRGGLAAALDEATTRAW